MGQKPIHISKRVTYELIKLSVGDILEHPQMKNNVLLLYKIVCNIKTHFIYVEAFKLEKRTLYYFYELVKAC